MESRSSSDRVISQHIAATGKVVANVPVEIGCIKTFRAENFPESGPHPWLDRPDVTEEIARRLKARNLTDHEARYCQKWADDGYIILEKLIPDDILDEVWAEYEGAIANGTIVLPPEKISPDDPHPGRFLNAHVSVPAIDGLLRHSALLRVAEVLLGRKPIPFQTIMSHKGSQAREHSDSIHMTTYPLGYLVACWVAFEDIVADSGPLIYYPGSHRLPYLLSKEMGIPEGEFGRVGYGAYHNVYEPTIKQVVTEKGFEPHYFLARKGDVLFWHANIVHGGSPRKAVPPSRHALVCHYFAKGCICYHDLAEQPANVHGPVENFPVCQASGVSGYMTALQRMRRSLHRVYTEAVKRPVRRVFRHF